MLLSASNPSAGEMEIHWPADLACLLSSRTVRDLVSKDTHTNTDIYNTHIHIYLHAYSQ